MVARQTVKSATSTTAWHKTSADNKNTRLDRGQDNGELSDMVQKDCTTLDTTSEIFPRLRYDITYGANSNSQLGPLPKNGRERERKLVIQTEHTL